MTISRLTLTKFGFQSLLSISTGSSSILQKDNYSHVIHLSGYDKIKNWFSNTRQKDALLWRLANPSITDQYNLASTLLTVHIEGREMKLRPQALEHCKESDWSDEFFYQVVLVNDWKMVGKVREMKLREEAAYGLLELRLRRLP